MKFFSLLLISSYFLFSLTSCTDDVEDKNNGLTSSEKEELATEVEKETIEVDNISFESQQINREDMSSNSNVLSKSYTIKVCMKDKQIVKGLGNRRVLIDGKASKTDTSGCVRINHEIKLDYKSNNRCFVFLKNIKFSNNKQLNLKYSIDYVDDQITDLAHSKGCVVEKSKIKTAQNSELVYLKKVSLIYIKNLSKVQSDRRFIEHESKITSCIDIHKTGDPLANAQVKITLKNLETGEVIRPDNNGKNFKTNYNGCFIGSFVSKFEQYRNSHWMELDLRVEILSGALKGAVTRRSVYINPWEPSRHLYGFTEPGLKPAEIEFKNKYARFHMDGVMYIQIGNDTNKMEVNDYLGLTISKSYQIVLNPYIDREHRYTPGKLPVERMYHEGEFKLSMMLLAPREGDMEINKHNFEDFDFITGAEKIVKVKNGIINELMNIPFKMTDLPRLAVRTMSVFKIEPVGNTGLESSVVTGFFKARIAWIKTNVLQSSVLNIPNYVDRTWESVMEGRTKSDMTLEKMDASCSQEKGISREYCLKGLTEILSSNIDSKAIAYRKYIAKQFSRLEMQTSGTYKKNEKKFSAKEIYINHLKKNYPGIKNHNLKSLVKRKRIAIQSKDFDELMPENQAFHGVTDSLALQLCEELRSKGARDASLSTWFLGTFGVDKNMAYRDCLASPNKYFGIKSTRHVKKVTKIKKSYTNGFVIYVGERYGVSAGERDSVSDSWSYSGGVDLGGRLPIPFIGDFANLGLKGGINWQHQESHSSGDGYNYSENIGTSKNLSVEKFVVDLDVNFERCLLIQSLDKVNRWRAETKSSGRKSKNPEDWKETFSVCDPKVKKEQFTESWYFVQSRIESSIGRDFDGVTERKLLKVLRGTDSYRFFREALRDSAEKSLLMDNIAYSTPEDVLIKSWSHLLGAKLSDEDAAKFLLENVEGSFPGTIEGNGSTPADMF
jgi:hypothetical protein